MRTSIVLFIIALFSASIYWGCKKDDNPIIVDFNKPPNTPRDPIPIDTALNQPANVTLTWSCSDAENDSLTYDVYFGTENPPATKVAAEQSAKYLDRNGLTIHTTYYWTVVAMDGHNHSASGPVWKFTTSSGGIPCSGTPTVTYAGKIYHTVQIDNQCWLKENLDVGTMVDSLQNQVNNSIIEKYCYRNDTANCSTYGGLYKWSEAMQYSTTEGAQGICPTGWHIPTSAEYDTLATSVHFDGNALKAWGIGTATNSSGFSALMAGGGGGFDGHFDFLGSYTWIWSSTEFTSIESYCLNITYFGRDFGMFSNDVDWALSVRCLKD
jgi:uncharacterized protein (TIGR02145 family)